MRPLRRGWPAAIVVICLIVVAAIWGQSGSRIITRTMTHGRSQQVELRTANHWQALRSQGLEMPGYARLIRNGEGGAVDDSGVFDLDGVGDIFWTASGDVQVGSTARFDRRSGRWQVSPGG